MKMFLLGMLTMYLIIGLVLVLLDGKGGIELFDGWITNVLTLPELIFLEIAIFITKRMKRRKTDVFKSNNRRK